MMNLDPRRIAEWNRRLDAVELSLRRHERQLTALELAEQTPHIHNGEAERLWACRDGSPQWAERWAELAQRAGWPCSHPGGWKGWADEIANSQADGAIADFETYRLRGQ